MSNIADDRRPSIKGGMKVGGILPNKSPYIRDP